MRNPIILPILAAAFAFSSSAAAAQEPPRVAETLFFGDRSPEWRPDWPADLPPDAFSLRGSRPPRSVVVSIEGSDDESSVEYSARWSVAGAIVERPLFAAGSVFALSFDRDDRVRGYRIAPIEASEGEKSADESVRLIHSSDGTLAAAERKTAEGSVSSTFSYRGSQFEELSFDEEGLLVGRSVCDFSGPLLVACSSYAEDGSFSASARFDYDAHGRVVRVESAESSSETVFDADGRPAFVRAAADAERTERRFQWDERGLLVREFLTDAGGETLEISYSYDFDARGEWIARDSSLFVDRFGTRAPEKGPRVLRKIGYR